MKYLKINLFLIVILIPNFMFGQYTDPVLYRAFYSLEYIHKTDVDKDSIHKESMTLLIGQKASNFVSYDKLVQGKNAQKQIDEELNNYVGDNTPHIDLSLPKVILPEEIFRFEEDKKMFVRDNLLRNYLYADEFPVIDWQISQETKEIMGMQCQKATAGFKGRNWTVWFAPELPFKTGPWKLGGLPGLILVAEDDTKEIVFQLTAFETAKGSDSQWEFEDYQIIALPDKKIHKVDKKTFDKLMLAASSNMSAFIRSQIQAHRGGVLEDSSIAPRFLLLRANNPFEKE